MSGLLEQLHIALALVALLLILDRDRANSITARWLPPADSGYLSVPLVVGTLMALAAVFDGNRGEWIAAISHFIFALALVQQVRLQRRMRRRAVTLG